MCSDGKCEERRGRWLEAVIHLGHAVRSMAQGTGKPHMVLQMNGHIAIGMVIPEVVGLPNGSVIITADADTSDEEIERRANEYVSRPRLSLLEELLATLLGAEPDEALSVEPMRMMRTRTRNSLLDRDAPPPADAAIEG